MIPLVGAKFKRVKRRGSARRIRENLVSRTERAPHVVLVGAGFGGLAAARALRRAPVRITILDRSNHHLFQPLLYQVATAALSPADIAAPIRRIFRHQANVTVMLADATADQRDRETGRACWTALSITTS